MGQVTAAQKTKQQGQAQTERDWRQAGAAVSPLVRPLLRIIVILVAFWGVATFFALALVPFAAADWVEDWGLRLLASFCQHLADGIVTYALLPVATYGPQLIVAALVLLRCYYAVLRDLRQRRRRGPG